MKTKLAFFIALLCSMTSLAQPANDICSAALPINPNNGCVNGTTVGADDSWIGSVGCQGGGNNLDVWYSFTAINGQLNYDVTTTGPWVGDVEFILVSATSACTGLSVAGSDCGPSILTGTINGLQIGTLYYITISTPNGGTPGTFDLCIDNVAVPVAPGQDCSTAAILCDGATFSQSTSSAGFGLQEINPANSCWGAGGERQSKWFKFTVGCTGTLEFNINPVTSGNDYDWSLYNTTTAGCPTTASPIPSELACNWSGCKGSTGITTCVDAVGEPGRVASGAGCGGNPAAWNVQTLTVTAGNTYALLVDNFSTSNDGFSLTFGGACGGGTAVIGPDANFTFTNPSCGVYSFTKTCQTTNSTFLWTFGDGATSTLQNPTHTYGTTGTFTTVLTVTDALGCTRTSSETFTVNFPVGTATPNPDLICSGETTSIVLTSNISPTTYSWIATNNVNVTGEDLVAQTSTTIANTLINASGAPQVVTYTVTPTAAGCVGPNVIVLVTVNPPATISGTGPICIGGTVQLTGSGTPNGATPWTSSSPAVATVSNTGLVTGVSAGSTTITYMDNAGCTVTLNITVNPAPTISGNAPVCMGSTLTLTGSGVPNAVTPWTSSNTGVATVSNAGLVTPVSPGTTTITYTDNAGCQITAIVTVNALPTISGNAPICVLGTVQLTGSAIPNAVTPWTSSNTGVATVSNTGLVTAVAAGTSTITYTNTNGCQTTVIVTVNALPTISGNAPICVGQTVQLSGSGTPNGVTPWTSTNTGVATVSNTGLVTGVAGGTSTITYTNSNGCQQTVVVTVNALPTISGNAPICIGSTVQLTGSATPNGTTPWTSSVTGVATVSNTGLVTGIAAGTSTITYTNSNGCQTTVVVTVNPLPAITGNAPICVGATLALTGSATPNATTPWTSSNTGVATVSNTGVVTGVAAGTATITYTNTNGCQATVVVTINALPTISGNSPICIGSTVLLTGSGTPNATTPWTSSNTGVATVGSTGLVTGVAAGTSTITYTNSNGCQTTVVVTVNASPIISTSQTPLTGCNSNNGIIQVTGGAATGTVNWTGTASGTSGVVTLPFNITALAAGTYNVTFTSSVTGCTSLSSQQVLINPGAPIVNPIANYSSCGVSFTLLNANITGTLTGGQAYYSAPGGLPANLIPNGTVFTAPTNTTVYAYDSNGFCSSEQSFTIVINSLPTISGAAPICVNGTVQLTGSGTPNGSTPWASSNNGVATISVTGLVTGIAAGSTTITYTNSNGCQITTSITVNALPTISGNAPICVGATLALTGSATANATTPWVSSNTGIATVSNAGVVTGVAQGTSTITYTNSNGCQTTQVVTVNGTPTIAGNAPICVGATVQLSGSGVPNATTPWVSSNTGVATISNTGLVTGVSAGTATMTYTNNNGCQTTALVTVNALPTISGTATVCAGLTTQLTGSGTPNATSPWVSANLSVATVSNAGLVTGVAPGTSTITYTNNAGCQITTVVTVNPTPTISGNAPICGTSTLQLTGSGTPNGVTPWTSSNTGVATVGNTGLVSGVSGGSTTITYTNSNGCQVTEVVVVNSLPTIAGTAPICIGDQIQLTGSGTPNTTTPWASSNPGIATVSSSGMVTGVAAGTATITYTDANGCQNTTNVVVNASPVIDPINSQLACDVFTLPPITGTNLTAAVSYWDAAGGTGNQLFATNQITTSMTVFIYDINGTCSSEESFTVTITPTPALDPVADVTACTSYTLPTIMGTDLSGSVAYYDDSQANGGVQITGSITTTQVVWIFDSNGACTDETSYLVTINTAPTATISGGGTYCAGDPVTDVVVIASGTPDWTINFTLDGALQSVTSSANPIVLGNTPGTYVLVDITDGLCSGTLSGSETITVSSLPSEPLAGTDAEYCSTGNFDDMTASGTGGTFTWYSDAALTNVLGTGSTIVPLNVVGTSTYYVTETLNGCEGGSSSVQISIVECNIVVPTAFTPNGDNVHETWTLINLDEAYPNNIVRIYNRWGNILFESNPGEYNQDEWDGTYKGELMPVGSYYYIIELNNDEKESLTGTVTIILD